MELHVFVRAGGAGHVLAPWMFELHYAGFSIEFSLRTCRESVWLCLSRVDVEGCSCLDIVGLQVRGCAVESWLELLLVRLGLVGMASRAAR
eukprot:7599988-Alexandrium_andersonii.AAC.1